jgi:biopolymer transport protein ExbD
MTPMIDVLLVLIVIFMVIAPIAPKGLETLIPQSALPERVAPEREDNLIVSVLGDGSLRINQEPVAWEIFESRLRAILGNRGNRVVFVRGERGIDFEPVALAIDLAKQAGAGRIGLMQ